MILSIIHNIVTLWSWFALIVLWFIPVAHSQTEWITSEAILAKPLKQHLMPIYNNQIHVIGGIVPGGQGDGHKLNTCGNTSLPLTSSTTWDIFSTGPANPQGMTKIIEWGDITVQVNDTFYIFNPDTDISALSKHSLVVFDLSSRTLSEGPTPPEASKGVCVVHSASTGIIYVLGGGLQGTFIRSTQRYHIADNTWLSNGGNTVIARQFAGCATDTTQNFLYYFGGRQNVTYCDEIEQYSVTANVWWGISTTLSVPRQNLKCRLLPGLGAKGRIYCVGGDNGTDALTTVDILDLSTMAMDAPQQGQQLSIRRSMFALTVWNSRCLIASGGGVNLTAATDSIEMLGDCTVEVNTTHTPTVAPSDSTSNPSNNPSNIQTTANPTRYPTSAPITHNPTRNPTHNPSKNPTHNPSNIPTHNPSNHPTTTPTKYPTTAPITNNPTHNPSNNPTRNPSNHPTHNPTRNPSNNPTHNPTHNPSSIPSNIRTTANPTRYPTRNPSNHPTHNPSNIPTDNPSNNPTTTPTHNPTSIPTLRPTLIPSSAPTVSFSALGVWSSTFLSIFIDIQITLDSTSLINNCSAIFDGTTMKRLGKEDAVCTWLYSENTPHTQDILIQLPSTATINLTHNHIVMTPGAFNFKIDSLVFTLSTSIDISIEPPELISEPNIITNIPLAIGRCDDLTLDARSTTNLGGRYNAHFEWSIDEANITKEGSLVTVRNSEIAAMNDMIIVVLTVTNWYGGTSSSLIHIYKSALEFVPHIELSGVSEYSFASDKLLNGKIDIHSSIIFGNDCNDERIGLQSDQYTTHWFVSLCMMLFFYYLQY
eukprot:165872_1